MPLWLWKQEILNCLQKMIFIRDPISYLTEYRIYPSADYLRRKVYNPQSLYCDYYSPIRSLFWNSSYWPLYRTVRSFENEVKGGTGFRLQKVSSDEELMFDYVFLQDVLCFFWFFKFGQRNFFICTEEKMSKQIVKNNIGTDNIISLLFMNC